MPKPVVQKKRKILSKGKNIKSSVKDKVLIQVKIDRHYRDQARMVLEDIGLDVTTAVGIFLRTVAKQQQIPFSLTTFDPDDYLGEDQIQEMKKSQKKIAQGKYYTLEQVEARYNIKPHATAVYRKGHTVSR